MDATSTAGERRCATWQRGAGDPIDRVERRHGMTLVDATTTRAPGADAGRNRRRGLQEWALTRTSPQDQAAAIDLVLTHDFDEPGREPVTDRAAAQRLAERYLVEVIGISVREPDQTLASLRTESAAYVAPLAA